MFKKSKHQILPICKNCRLFDEKNSLCSVVILYEGEKINLPVTPEDKCFFENEFIDKNNEKFKVGVEQIKIWVEDEKTGKKSDHGTVKIEIPETLEIEAK